MPASSLDDALIIARTPVQRLTVDAEQGVFLWVKRDDQTHPRYGGNKARKLRHILADARHREVKRIVTFGVAGSHHVLSTTLFATSLGIDVGAVLSPQPRTEHARDVLRAALAHGLEAWPAQPAFLTPLVFLAHVRRGDLVVPLGGSNVLGARGYVDAAEELRHAVSHHEMPEPDVLVVPVGSGGTAAGLCAGLARTSLRTRVHGALVMSPPWLGEALTRSLVARITRGDRSWRREALSRLTFDAAYRGGGYGQATAEGARAAEFGARNDLVTDPTYTAKALACALDLARRYPRRCVLFWHTLSSAPMDPLLRNAPRDLPPALDRLLT